MGFVRQGSATNAVSSSKSLGPNEAESNRVFIRDDDAMPDRDVQEKKNRFR